MRKFLVLAICLSLASTLVVSLGCKKKEEAPPAAMEEVTPAVPEETTEAPSIPEKPQAEEEELQKGYPEEEIPETPLVP